MKNDKDFAVVIGLDDYMALAPLKGPIGDARDFRSWLLDPQGGNLPEENCKLIESCGKTFRPLQDDIDEKLGEIIAQDDGSFRRLYFFFAGHGIGINWNANGLCMPKWSDIFRNYALSSKDYLAFAVECSVFQEVYFFLDCCRQRKINVKPLHPTLGPARARGGGVSGVVIYAAPFENPASEGAVSGEGDGLVRGFFSRALVEGLYGAAADTGGNISAAGLINFTRLRTEELAREAGKVQLVNSEIADGGRSLDELLLRTGIAPVLVELNICFRSAGRMRLCGPDLAVLLEKEVAAGGILPAQHLRKGLYSLQELAAGRKEYIEITGLDNTIDYEFS